MQDSQELWAVGLNIGYSNNLAMVKLLTAVTNGHLDVNQSKFHIITNNTIQNNVVYRSKRRKPEPSNELVNNIILFFMMIFNKCGMKNDLSLA